MRSIKRRLIPFVAAGALTLGLAGTAAAAPPTFVLTGGLVNVTIVDAVDIEDNVVIVQVPLAAAANICNLDAVDVAILAAIINSGQTATCTADADSNAGGNSGN